MRLDAVLDSFYLLGSLWGGLPSLQVCPASPAVASRAALEAAWRSRPQGSGAVTAFVGVNVIPMDTERVLASQTVLVEGGLITALGPTNQVKVPAGAVQVDGRGKYLIPGLANMHWHVPWGEYDQASDGFTGLRPFFSVMLKHGVTTLRSLMDQDPAALLKLKRLTQEIPSPRLYMAWRKGLQGGMRLDSLDNYIAAAKAAGYTHIGTPPQRYFHDGSIPRAEQDQLMDSLTAAARRAGLPISTHVHQLRLETALKVGVTGGSVDHLYLFMNYENGMLRGPVSVAQVAPIVAALKRAGVWVTPTLGCWEGPNLPLGRKIVKAMHDAGVKLLLGSDEAPVTGELAMLVSAGLTPYQALETGTRNVAQYLGVQDSGGAVAVGKWADLVLLRNNPLDNIDHVKEPAGVMVAGRWLDVPEIPRQSVSEPRRGD